MPTSVDVEIHRVALGLYRRARTRDLPIRLVGVALSKLSLDDGQTRLATFEADERRGEAVDAIREKFGYDAVHLATTTGPRRRRPGSGPGPGPGPGTG